MTEPTKPRTRAGCQAEGACPFVSCRYHLWLDVAQSGSLLTGRQTAFTFKPKRRDFEAWSDELTDCIAEAEHTCALDVATDGGHTLTETGRMLGVVRERIRQIEDSALAKLRRTASRDMPEAMLDLRGSLSSPLAAAQDDGLDLPMGHEIRRGIRRLEVHRDLFRAKQLAAERLKTC